MKNNKRALLVDLKERLGCTEEECLIINDIIEEYNNSNSDIILYVLKEFPEECPVKPYLLKQINYLENKYKEKEYELNQKIFVMKKEKNEIFNKSKTKLSNE